MARPQRPAIFKWRHFAPEVILCAVRWYLRYSVKACRKAGSSRPLLRHHLRYRTPAWKCPAASSRFFPRQRRFAKVQSELPAIHFSSRRAIRVPREDRKASGQPVRLRIWHAALRRKWAIAADIVDPNSALKMSRVVGALLLMGWVVVGSASVDYLISRAQ